MLENLSACIWGAPYLCNKPKNSFYNTLNLPIVMELHKCKSSQTLLMNVAARLRTLSLKAKG